MNRSKAMGALMGLAVGDAFGTTNEFAHPQGLPGYPTLVTGPQTDIVGGGPFRLERGQVTDDTHMACCIASSLRTLGRYDADDVARRYVTWREVTFDCGGQTGASLTLVARGTPALEAGRVAWENAGKAPAGNGSLMRCAPIAVFYAGGEGAARISLIEDSLITHADPRCVLACVGFGQMIGGFVRGDYQSPSDALTGAALAIGKAVGTIRDCGIPLPPILLARAASDLASDIEAAGRADPDLGGDDAPGLWSTPGFVRVAFRLACWHLARGHSYRDAIIDTGNRGGDADTNCAIVGALLGAAQGLEAIPEAWRSTVLGALNKAGPGKHRPFRDLYHPDLLVRMVDNLAPEETT